MGAFFSASALVDPSLAPPPPFRTDVPLCVFTGAGAIVRPHMPSTPFERTVPTDTTDGNDGASNLPAADGCSDTGAYYMHSTTKASRDIILWHHPDIVFRPRTPQVTPTVSDPTSASRLPAASRLSPYHRRPTRPPPRATPCW
jgi:hypothetical protein